MKLNENALSILVALENEPATRETLSEILDRPELILRPLMGKLVNDKLISPLKTRCRISNGVLFDLTEDGRRILGEREEAKAVAQPKKPVKTARAAKVEAPAPAQPPEDAVMPDADPVLLASANRMLLDRLHGAALALREFGIPALERADGNDEIQGYIRLAAALCREQRDEINRLEADHRSLQELMQADFESYRRELAALKEKAAISDAPVKRRRTVP